MKPKNVLLITVVVLLAVLAAPMMAAAAPPIPSDQMQGPELAGPAPEGFVWPKDLAGTMSAMEARAFKNSLTEAQRDAIEDVLNQYAPEFEAIAKTLPSVDALKARTLSAIGAQPVAPTQEEFAQAAADLQAAKAALAQLSEVQAKIDRELASILTEAQWARQQAALSSFKSKGQAAKVAMNASGSRPDISPTLNAAGCNYSAQYASLADYYADYAYTYAYYNYIYNYYGSYNAYYYAYYANDYTYYALYELAAAHFDIGIMGSDRNSFGYYGIDDAYNALYYSYYAYNYAYSNYSSYGYTYAYYAYSLAYSAYVTANTSYSYGYAYCQ